MLTCDEPQPENNEGRCCTVSNAFAAKPEPAQDRAFEHSNVKLSPTKFNTRVDSEVCCQKDVDTCNLEVETTTTLDPEHKEEVKYNDSNLQLYFTLFYY